MSTARTRKPKKLHEAFHISVLIFRCGLSLYEIPCYVKHTKIFLSNQINFHKRTDGIQSKKDTCVSYLRARYLCARAHTAANNSTIRQTQEWKNVFAINKCLHKIINLIWLPSQAKYVAKCSASIVKARKLTESSSCRKMSYLFRK